jgi:hypothetical protein
VKLPLLIAISALAATSCAHVIIDQPIDLRGDGWDLTLRRLTDGPNSYSEGNTQHMPSKGLRFVWVHVTLHNTQPIPRKFNFDRCDLDAGQDAIVPSLIDADAFINWTVNREPELSAGETVTRRLIYAYPRDRSPTRLSCAPMIVPLPQF